MTQAITNAPTLQTKHRPARRTWPRHLVYAINRSIIVALVVVGIGSLLWQPQGWLQWGVDFLGRAYVMFLATVLAHEASHGNLGRTRAINAWWGRLVMLTMTVPFLNFNKTHRIHHAYTNVEDDDPDYFLKSRYHGIEFIGRALFLPHQWLWWLHRRNKLTRRDLVEIGLNYIVVFMVYGAVLYAVGPARLAWGMLPPLVAFSCFLWYYFGVRMHEGFHEGPQIERSHNYFGRVAFWFSLGLSMHRTHHMNPTLSWVELLPYCKRYEGPWYRRIFFPRQMQAPTAARPARPSSRAA
jgi:fatty acid desaturase